MLANTIPVTERGRDQRQQPRGKIPRHRRDFVWCRICQGEKNNVASQFPDIVSDLEARLLTYAKEMKPSQWIKVQPAFLGAQGKTIFDPDFDIDDSGLPHEKPLLPK
jgi:hypothetical protein